MQFLKMVLLTTYLHTTKADCHQYFHCSYSNSDRIQISTIYSQASRLSNICKHKKDFSKKVLNIKSWFLGTGYSGPMNDYHFGKG